jgi:glycosyltransferase involved in cell wall biosynthesis
MKKICHLTSVHPPFDIRIFYKECKTIIQAGYKAVLIVPHDREEEIDSIQIRALPKAKNRLERMTRVIREMYRTAIRENADIYHFHDPELIPVGLLLKLHGKRVIYDVHENYSQTFLSKEWIPPQLRPMITKMVVFEEFVGTKFFDGIVTATPSIAARFPTFKTVTVQNFPFLNGSIIDSSIPYNERESVIVYVGLISALRGVKEMIQALALLPPQLEVKLKLAGIFSPSNLEDEVRTFPGWNRVDYIGWQFHKDIMKMLGKAKIGLVVLHPSPNHIKSQPNKLFEYMAAGIPVIASDFPLWREIIEKARCGLLVNPLDTRAIADAIRWLLEHPSEAEAMGKQGQKAVFEYYNWEGEAKKLLAFYNSILDK